MQTLQNPMRPPDTPSRLSGYRALRWLVTGAIGTVLIIVGAYYFDVVTESDEFCGALCHPNYPEYITHEVSDHARVECGTCHIGPGLMPKVMAKVYGVEELFLLATNIYEQPISPPVKRLRPAREICEQCHRPEKFYTDRVISRSTFAEDEENSETQTYLILRTGGGERPAPNSSIHWHVENPVWYVTTDAARQDIPWVGVMGSDGEMVEYWAQDTDLTPEDLEKLPRREMDCMDCHNRVTHVFRKPAQSVNEAIENGHIDRDLPYVKREAVKLLSASYPTQEAGIEAMNELVQFYRTKYPDVYAEKQQAIEEAVVVLQDIYEHTVFPSMNVTWEVYPDNIGHTDFPGCFRCHDGGHLNDNGESIRLSCNICHSVPVTTRPGQKPDLANTITFITEDGQEPESHLSTNFIRDHRFQANESCVECHGPAEFGDDNSSFCANYACHGQAWPEVDLSTAFPHPIELVGQHAEVTCNACHQGEEEPPSDDCAACHQPVSEPHFGPDCAQCHTPEGWEQALDHNGTAFPLTGAHLEATCQNCHADDVFQGTPQNCYACHQADDTHDGQFGPDCATCHSPESWEQATFNHSRTTAFPLLGRHVETTCQSCHTDYVFQDTPQSCYACHRADDAHIGQFGQDCATCHSPDGWEQATFDHNRTTAFPLLGRHVKVTCQSCHTDYVFQDTPQSCYACHQANDAHGGQFGLDCATCHSPEGWEQATFDHNRTTAFPLLGRHVEATCQSCHADYVFQDTPQSCYACHQADDAHGGQFGLDCATCHSPEGWEQATFDHSRTAFPLTGAHLETACTQCHVSGVYRGTSQACATCHADPTFHLGLLGSDCASCHNTAAWLPARYDRAHTFPINHGESGASSCRTCHSSTLSAYTCYSCHEQAGIEHEHREEGISDLQNCTRCHPTGREEEGDDD